MTLTSHFSPEHELVRYILLSDQPPPTPITTDVQEVPAPALERGTGLRTLSVLVGDQRHTVAVLCDGTPTLVLIDNKPYEVVQTGPNQYRCLGRPGKLSEVKTSHGPGATVAADPRFVKSPMAGRVVKVLCRANDSVAAGTPLVVLEAMKMENELRAPFAGIVRHVFVEDGQAVEGGTRLVELCSEVTDDAV